MMILTEESIPKRCFFRCIEHIDIRPRECSSAVSFVRYFFVWIVFGRNVVGRRIVYNLPAINK